MIRALAGGSLTPWAGGFSLLETARAACLTLLWSMVQSQFNSMGKYLAFARTHGRGD